MKKLFTLIGTVLLSMSVNAQTTTLKIAPFKIAPGEKKTITLDLDNPDYGVTSFRCDILLPEGITIEQEDGEYLLDWNADSDRGTVRNFGYPEAALQKDGSVRVLAYSSKNKTFTGTSGALIDIPLVASESMAVGTGEVKIYNQELTDEAANGYKPADYVATVTIEKSDAIKEVNANDAANGDGKYIKNGQIIIKKGNKEYNAVGGIMK